LLVFSRLVSPAWTYVAELDRAQYLARESKVAQTTLARESKPANETLALVRADTRR
jgi:hypothetical protein